MTWGCSGIHEPTRDARTRRLRLLDTSLWAASAFPIPRLGLPHLYQFFFFSERDYAQENSSAG
jgi:hypothetical protein